MARPVKLSTRDRRMARRRPPLRVRAIASSDQSNVYVDPARGLIATRSLPILIYDERRLTPALGYVFPAYWVHPHESLLCMSWKFALQNAIPRHDLASLIARYKIDPYEGVAPRKEYVM